MNQPSSRHPLFAAIACIALAGAWGTGAYESETGESLGLVSMVAADAPASQRLGADCSGPRGPTRVLCLFEASRPNGVAVPDVRVSTRQRSDDSATP